MYWKRKSNFLKTTTFRLTLWYLILFSVLSVAVFLVVYVSLSLRLQRQTDNELQNEAREFASLYQERNADALQTEFVREAESQGTGHVLFQLLSANGQSLVFSDLSKWKGLETICSNRLFTQTTQPFYRTCTLPRQRHKVRLLFMPISGGKWINVGISLQREELILENYRKTFSIALIAMVGCGGLFGFLLAKKAMTGVQRVTDTATEIGRNALGRRVEVGDEGEEIKSLERAFNAMLERIEILLSELQQITDNVAHELRTPITRIRGVAETTLKGSTDVIEYREMAASVINGCDDLIEMIATMLEITITDSGTAELKLAPLNLLQLIEEAVDLFEPAAEDKGITIRLIKSTQQVIVDGDRRKIQRVVANLLDNAIKYTPDNGVITITTGINARKASIEIADTGIGINENDIPHIFERFYRADKSRSTLGNGLGLALALAIAHAHGGNISIKSSQHGSTFTLSLPIVSSSCVSL